VLPLSSEIETDTHENDNQELFIIISGCGMKCVDAEKSDSGPGDWSSIDLMDPIVWWISAMWI
jgi:hypothetical protein